jgi:hypothetical protein
VLFLDVVARLLERGLTRRVRIELFWAFFLLLKLLLFPLFILELLRPKLFISELLGPELLGPELFIPELLSPELLGPELLSPELLGPELLIPELLFITELRPLFPLRVAFFSCRATFVAVSKVVISCSRSISVLLPTPLL